MVVCTGARAGSDASVGEERAPLKACVMAPLGTDLGKRLGRYKLSLVAVLCEEYRCHAGPPPDVNG